MEEREVKPYWDFKNNPGICIPPPNAMVLNLYTYEATRKVRSVRRAIRKGRVSPNGVIFPTRPFHNKKNTSKHGDSRQMNTEKKRIYARLKAESRREEQL